MVITEVGRKGLPDARKREFDTLHALHVQESSYEVWTDGSQRTAASGAFAIYAPGQSTPLIARGFALPFVVSSTWSELHALHQALLALAADITNRSIWLFTDSLSAIQAICSKSTSCDSIVFDILHCIREQQRNCTTVHCMHVPAHCGIDRNERVDALAAEFSALPLQVPVSASEPISLFQRLVARSELASWTARQSSTTAQLYLKAYMRCSAPLKVHRTLTRFQSVILSQLRCGRSPVIGDLQRRVRHSDLLDIPLCRSPWAKLWATQEMMP
eukprot:848732-Amphidinium_carterae.1